MSKTFDFYLKEQKNITIEKAILSIEKSIFGRRMSCSVLTDRQKGEIEGLEIAIFLLRKELDNE